jgi:hypothetical protein
MMTEKKESQLKFVIKKQESYKSHTCITGLTPEKDKEFNSMQEVEVTKEEFERLTKFRWAAGVLNGSK